MDLEEINEKIAKLEASLIKTEPYSFKRNPPLTKTIFSMFSMLFIGISTGMFIAAAISVDLFNDVNASMIFKASCSLAMCCTLINVFLRSKS